MDKITNYKEFLIFIKIDENIDIIGGNLKEIMKIISSGNISGTPFNRKYLENFLEYLFKYIMDELPLKNSRIFIEKFFAVILDLAFMYQEKFNKLVKDFLNEKAQIISDGFDTAEEIKKTENDSKSIIAQFIKSGILFSYLTYNIKQTNQLISNFILLCVSILNNLKIDSTNADKRENLIKILNLKFILISILTIISENINCYNPDVLNCFKNILNLFEVIELANSKGNNTKEKAETLKSCLEFGSNFDLFALNKLSVLNNETRDNNNNSSIFIFLKKTLNANLELLKFYKDDINFNILFVDNIRFLQKAEKFIEENLKKHETAYFEGIYTQNYLSKIKEIYQIYEINQEKCLAKKNVQINFLLLKPKAIPSLEPEYEFGPVDFVKRKEKVNKAIEIKVKKTKKQAIRNLKKESRILDQERQKVLKKFAYKRKEDQKSANQFIEQQNQEAKKMDTTNPKKRFKLRNGKINKK